jgi:galactose mutarotase-like enzyme
MIPVGTEVNTNQNFRFRDVDFDDCFSELERTNGIAEIKIDYEDRQIVLWQDQAFDFVMVFTTNDFESVSGQQTAMAIEAQSCAANAFNSERPFLLAKDSFRGSWGLQIGKQLVESDYE